MLLFSAVAEAGSLKHKLLPNRNTTAGGEVLLLLEGRRDRVPVTCR